MQYICVSLTIINWLNKNYWWPIVLILVALLVVVKVFILKPKDKKEIDFNEQSEDIINYLGGIKNIKQVTLDGNRVKFKVHNIEITNLEAFKSIGATGVFISGDNVKMVLPFDSKNLVDKINSNINGGKL